MNPDELISVVITTYNRSDALLAVLRGFAAQTDKRFEIVVADDGSSEVHQHALASSPLAKQLRIDHVWHPDSGFTAPRSRNLGAAASRGSYLVFLDGDCVPDKDFVAQHRRLAEHGAFVNGSRVLLSPTLTQRVIQDQEAIVGRAAMYWVNRYLRGESNKVSNTLRLPDMRWRRQSHFVWSGIRSCNLAVWRADFDQVNGFDASFVGWGHEDADFVLRLHNAGLVRKNGFCATEVFHLWHPEASRASEGANAERVRARQSTGLIQAETGWSDCLYAPDVRITRCG